MPKKVSKVDKLLLNKLSLHENVEKLSSLKNMMLMLQHSMKDISLSVYSTVNNAVINGDKCRTALLSKGTHKAYYVASPDYDKLPKGIHSGDLLHGSITYREKDSTESGSSTKPGGFIIKYNIPPEPKKGKEPEVAEPDDDRPEEEKTNDAIRDLLIERLKKLDKKEEFDNIYQNLIEKYPNHVPLLEAKLDFVKESDEIIIAAQTIIGTIDKEDLIQHFGLKTPKDDPVAQKTHKEKNKLKESLIGAYAKQLSALGDREEEFMKLYKEFQKWVDDVHNYKYILIVLSYYEFKEEYGTSLAKLIKFYETDKKDRVKVMEDKEYYERLEGVLEKLGWGHLQGLLKQENLLDYPADYAPF